MHVRAKIHRKREREWERECQKDSEREQERKRERSEKEREKEKKYYLHAGMPASNKCMACMHVCVGNEQECENEVCVL